MAAHSITIGMRATWRLMLALIFRKLVTCPEKHYHWGCPTAVSHKDSDMVILIATTPAKNATWRVYQKSSQEKSTSHTFRLMNSCPILLQYCGSQKASLSWRRGNMILRESAVSFTCCCKPRKLIYCVLLKKYGLKIIFAVTYGKCSCCCCTPYGAVLCFHSTI